MFAYLKGKKIIVFCPKFFGYENEIIREMESLGAVITFHGQLPSEHPWIKGLFRLAPKFSWRYADRYFFTWLQKHGPETCDIILVIKGEGLSPTFLQHMRSRYPQARIVLHLWDSLVNCKNIHQKLPLFDSLSSFDFADCKKFPQFKYRPLFFLNKYLKRETGNTGHGIFFIGTLNGDRPKVISRLIKSLNRNSEFWFWLFVRSRLELALRKIFDSSLRQIDKTHFIYKPMPAETISQHFNECSAVLDIEHPNQSGLTMRTFEVIASGKKLITTNADMINYDFYDPDRICIIDRNNPVIPNEFLAKPVPELPVEFIKQHSLRRWIVDILSH